MYSNSFQKVFLIRNYILILTTYRTPSNRSNRNSVVLYSHEMTTTTSNYSQTSVSQVMATFLACWVLFYFLISVLFLIPRQNYETKSRVKLSLSLQWKISILFSGFVKLEIMRKPIGYLDRENIHNNIICLTS